MIDAVVAKAINDAWQQNKANLRQSSNPRFVEHNSPLVRHEDRQLDYKQLKLSRISSASVHAAEQFKNDNGRPASPSDLETRSTLKYTVEIVGDPPTDSGSRPLYIALHGGGGTATAVNDGQWESMAHLYKGAIKSGVWIAARGIGDTWDLHFTGAGYVLIERLVENMIIFGATDKNHATPVDIDPNRVYLIGFSAGGDGVYRLAPRLAQRFAAVNMGGGHPGSVLASSESKRPTLLRNLVNTPICVQVGEKDSAGVERSKMVAQSAMDLDEVKNYYTNVFHGISSPIFIHDVFIHPTDPDPQQEPNESQKKFNDRLYEHRHNSWEVKNFSWPNPNVAREQQPVIFNYAAWRTGWVGNFPSTARETVKRFTNAIDWLNKHTRTPRPQAVVWDLLRGKANDQFDDKVFGGLSGHGTQNYWLDISGKNIEDVGDLIEARVDYDTSTIYVTSAHKYLRILLRPEMVHDMSKIKVEIQLGSQPKKTLGPYKLGWSQAIINHTLARNDPNLVFSSDIILNLVNNEWKVTTSSPAPVRALL